LNLQDKKILFIVNVDWFFVSHRLPIAIKAKEQGYQVHIAARLTNKLSLLEDCGFIIHPLNLHRSRTGVKIVISEFLEILSLIRNINPNIVHLITIKAVLLGGISARVAKIPAVVSAIPGLGFIFIRTGVMALFYRLIVSFFYRLSLNHKNQMVIFQNSSDQTKLNKIAKIPLQESIIINGSGVDLSVYNFKPIPRGIPVVLFSSRFLIDKGFKEFIEAAKIVNLHEKKARFIMVGDIDLSNPSSISRHEIDQYKRSGDVEFLGYLDGGLQEIYSLATMVVLPSYKEGFPKVLIEAAACGRAIVTTDVSGCRDAIDEGKTGLLVTARDSGMLASAIEELLNNTELCRNMGKAGRVRAEHLFDINLIVSSHMEIYKNLLMKSKSLG
jgi:glycosyltransferase involved in cell wall biosynthesis